MDTSYNHDLLLQVERLNTDMSRLLTRLITGREPQDITVPISSTFPYIVDSSKRRYLFLYSSIAMSLQAGDLGTINVQPNTWTNITVPEGTRLFAIGQITPVNVFIRSTDIDMTNVSTVNISQINGLPPAFSNALSVSLSPGTIPGYSAAVSAFAPIAAATDVINISGAPGVVIRITRIEANGNTSAAAFQNMLLIKRSSPNTGGTPTTLVAGPHDSIDAPAAATVVTYATNPTLGTTVATLRTIRAWCGAASQSDHAVWDFTTRAVKPLLLRNANESVSLNFGGSTVATPNFSISIEWSETIV